MEKIFVIVKRPDEPVGQIKEINNTLKSLQELVGGHIEAVPLATDLAIICNEEGRLQGMPNNCDIGGINFVGPIVAVGIEADDFTDCPVDLVDWQKYWLGK